MRLCSAKKIPSGMQVLAGRRMADVGDAWMLAGPGGTGGGSAQPLFGATPGSGRTPPGRVSGQDHRRSA